MKKQVKQSKLKLEKFKVAKINNPGKRKIMGGGDGIGVIENEKDDTTTTDMYGGSKYC